MSRHVETNWPKQFESKTEVMTKGAFMLEAERQACLLGIGHNIPGQGRRANVPVYKLDENGNPTTEVKKYVLEAPKRTDQLIPNGRTESTGAACLVTLAVLRSIYHSKTKNAFTKIRMDTDLHPVINEVCRVHDIFDLRQKESEKNTFISHFIERSIYHPLRYSNTAKAKLRPFILLNEGGIEYFVALPTDAEPTFEDVKASAHENSERSPGKMREKHEVLGCAAVLNACPETDPKVSQYVWWNDGADEVYTVLKAETRLSGTRVSLKSRAEKEAAKAGVEAPKLCASGAPTPTPPVATKSTTGAGVRFQVLKRKTLPSCATAKMPSCATEEQIKTICQNINEHASKPGSNPVEWGVRQAERIVSQFLLKFDIKSEHTDEILRRCAAFHFSKTGVEPVLKFLSNGF